MSRFAWFREALNKEPAMTLSGIVGIAAITMPYWIVPIRRSMGLATYQWDADPNTHPYLNHFGDNYKKHNFDNPDLLVSWSQHSKYKYDTQLPERERDFPEARARLAAKGL